MKPKTIIVSKTDHQRLRDFMMKENSDNIPHDVKKLDLVLKKAELVESENIPSDVITMNSRIRFRDVDFDEDYIYTLVYPDKPDMSDQHLSVLAPAGTALLGYKVGDIVRWEMDHGTITIAVEDLIYQPEAAGDYHL